MLTREQIIAAMSLDLAGVRKALDDNGWPDHNDIGIKAAQFKGMVSRQSFVYEILFPDHADLSLMHCGNVYISYGDVGKGVQLLGEY